MAFYPQFSIIQKRIWLSLLIIAVILLFAALILLLLGSQFADLSPEQIIMIQDWGAYFAFAAVCLLMANGLLAGYWIRYQFSKYNKKKQ